jgi:hypothetical protein
MECEVRAQELRKKTLSVKKLENKKKHLRWFMLAASIFEVQ